MKLKDTMSINQVAAQLGITQEELSGILSGVINIDEANPVFRAKLSHYLEVVDEVNEERKNVALSLESVAQHELDHIRLETEEFLRIVSHIFTSLEKKFFYIRAKSKDEKKLGRLLGVDDEIVNQIHNSLTEKCKSSSFVEIAYKIFICRDFEGAKLKHWLRALIILDSSIEIGIREVLMYYCLENITNEKLYQLAVKNNGVDRKMMISALEHAYEQVEKKYPYTRALFVPITIRFEAITVH